MNDGRDDEPLFVLMRSGLILRGQKIPIFRQHGLSAVGNSVLAQITVRYGALEFQSRPQRPGQRDLLHALQCSRVHGPVDQWLAAYRSLYISLGGPFSALSATNRVFNGAGSPTGRPNVVAGCDLYTGYQTVNQWFNPNCFALQPSGTYGNAGRDTITGPNLWNPDNSLTKDWAVAWISEQFRVQFRAEAFNIFNHPSFGQPANNVFSGTAVNTSVGRITFTTSAPRQIQLALKIVS